MVTPFLGSTTSSSSSSPPDKKRKRDRDDGGKGGGESGETTTSSSSDDMEDGGTEEDGGEYSDRPRHYELPDGTRLNLRCPSGKDLRRLPELFFSEELPFVGGAGSSSSKEKARGSPVAEWTLSSAPVHALTRLSLTAVGDSDARKELCSNVLLCGASGLYPNFPERLSYELSNSIPSAYKCRVVASRNSLERRYAAWIGGSILTSLGSFQQLWLSRKEYEEYGAMLGVQRFP